MKLSKEIEADFDHPCKQTCSGWRQGYEKGFAECLKLSHGLVEALESVVVEDQCDGCGLNTILVENAMAKQALKDFKERTQGE